MFALAKFSKNTGFFAQFFKASDGTFDAGVRRLGRRGFALVELPGHPVARRAEFASDAAGEGGGGGVKGLSTEHRIIPARVVVIIALRLIRR